jgi:hypothetical protein
VAAFIAISRVDSKRAVSETVGTVQAEISLSGSRW